MLLLCIPFGPVSAAPPTSFDPSKIQVVDEAPFPDMPLSEAIEQAFPSLPEIQAPAKPEATSASIVDKNAQEIARINRELASLSKEIKDTADAIRKEMPMQAIPDASWNIDVESLDRRVTALENAGFVTEERVRQLIVEEVNKQINVRLQMPDGTEKEVGVTITAPGGVYEEVAVKGYSGTFSVPAGATVVAVDGVPVTQQSASGGVATARAGTSYTLQSVRSGSSFQVRVQAPSPARRAIGWRWRN